MSLPPLIAWTVELLHPIFASSGIIYYFGGSVALVVLGNTERVPNDVDLYAGASAERIFTVLKGHERVQYLSTDPSKGHMKYGIKDTRTNARVEVDIFPINMEGLGISRVSGLPVSSPWQSCKSKMHAVATRGYPKDKGDMLWLLNKYFADLSGHRAQFKTTTVGQVVENFNELGPYFARLGFDIKLCRAEAAAARERAPRATVQEHMAQLDLVRRMADATRYGQAAVVEPIPTGQTFYAQYRQTQARVLAIGAAGTKSLRPDIFGDAAIAEQDVEQYAAYLRTIATSKGLQETPSLNAEQLRALARDPQRRKAFFGFEEQRLSGE